MNLTLVRCESCRRQSYWRQMPTFCPWCNSTQLLVGEPAKGEAEKSEDVLVLCECSACSRRTYHISANIPCPWGCPGQLQQVQPAQVLSMEEDKSFPYGKEFPAAGNPDTSSCGE